MNKKGFILAGILSLLLAAGMVPVNAQAPQAQEEQMEDEDIMYTFGTIAKVSAEEIVLWEYDYDKDEEAAVSYVVVPETELKGIKAITELKEGDAIEIYYVEEGGVRVAGLIQRDEAFAGDEEGTDMPEMTAPLEDAVAGGEE